MAFGPEFTVWGTFELRPQSDSDGPSTIDLHVHWKQFRRVCRRTNNGMLPPTEDEPIGPSSSSQFGFRFHRLSEFRRQIWISTATLDFPVVLSNFLLPRITSFVNDLVAESPTGLCPSRVIVANINLAQTLYVDDAPRPLEFIQTSQLAEASAFADENLILGTTTEGPEVNSNGFVGETFILRGPTEGWGGAQGDSDSFFDENFILGTLAEVDEDNNGGIEMLTPIKRGNWVMGGEEDVTCSVCMEDISEGQEVMTMACKHTYHEQCLLTWLDRNQTCPLCRRPI